MYKTRKIFYFIFIEYKANRLALAFKESTLPHIYGNNTIQFNADSDTRPLAPLQSFFNSLNSSVCSIRGLLFNQTAQRSIPLNHEITISSYKHIIYAPFVAQGGEDQPELRSWCQVETEVSKVVSGATLGLYSIFLFVTRCVQFNFLSSVLNLQCRLKAIATCGFSLPGIASNASGGAFNYKKLRQNFMADWQSTPITVDDEDWLHQLASVGETDQQEAMRALTENFEMADSFTIWMLEDETSTWLFQI
ncbi:hypothetical protein B0H14DRAFT_2630700 [Mycena olivaceomarginata]|nr:hypothetical protein B0H14DRAFT_2630700 [Mycena olivaceomarginata]